MPSEDMPARDVSTEKVVRSADFGTCIVERAISRALVPLIVGVSACGPPSAMVQPTPTPDPCIIAAAPSSRPDTLGVALLEPLNLENAPYGTNTAEELVFAQLYEALTEVDCLGQPRPGLARSWSHTSDGRRWTFQLDHNARYSDGTAVTAQDFVAQLFNKGPSADVDSAVARGMYELELHFRQPQAELPYTLTSRMFGIRDSGSMRLGSGSLAPVEDSPLRLLGRSTHAARGGRWAYVAFYKHARADPRDVLSPDVDLLVTSDPLSIEYASRQERFLVRPLPWDRTYVLASPSRMNGGQTGAVVNPVRREDLEALARDAVRQDSRGFESPGWWTNLGHCSAHVSRVHDEMNDVQAPDRHGLVIYDKGDAVARDLAARLVALAAQENGASTLATVLQEMSGGLALAAEGVEEAELSQRLSRGDDFLYVVSLPHRPPDACAEAHRLLDRVPWIPDLDEGIRGAILPLVDTRRHVILDSSHVGLAVDGLGRLLLMTAAADGERAP